MMRRMAVFLICLMPLQFSWAAISAYCEHETQSAAHHVGHHEHQHETNQSTGDVEFGSESKSVSFDPDCGVCHAGCLVAPCNAIASLGPRESEIAFEHPPSFHLPLFSSKPERPKWSDLA